MEVLRMQLELHFLYDPDVEATMNIAEYLIYMSKKNCDYKALITIIRMACPNDELEFTFIPVNMFHNSITENIQYNMISSL